jgi:predicted nucleic acid-binding protein
MTPDVNVLLAASRDDQPHHKTATTWLHQALEACEDGATFRLLPMVTAAFLRLMTNLPIYPTATPFIG